MSTTKEITRAALIVEIDGKIHQVALDQKAMMMLVHLAGGISDGPLQVLPAIESIFMSKPQAV